MCVGRCVCYRQTDGRGRQSSKKRQTDRQRQRQTERQRDTSEINPCLEDEEDHEDVSRLCRRMRNKSVCSSCSTQFSVHKRPHTRNVVYQNKYCIFQTYTY